MQLTSRMVRLAVVGVAALVMVAGAGNVAAAQRSGGGGGSTTIPSATGAPPGVPNVDSPAATGMDPAVRARMEQERVKALNDDRKKRLASDVDRLIELTNELKTDLGKAGKDELSLDVIKKAQEIEKLAHDVQSRMKN